MDSRPRYCHGDRLIDVNANTSLTGVSYGHRSSSPTQLRLISELQEQIRSYKRDLSKKDELINELSVGSPRLDAGRQYHIDSAILRESAPYRDDVTRYRISAESAGSELAAAHVKIENLTAENRDLHTRLLSKEKLIRELRDELEISKENTARQAALVQSLRDRVRAADDSSGTLEAVTTRGNITIQTLQKENREAQERILELEARVRSHLAEREEAEQAAETMKRKLHETVRTLGDALNIDTEGGQAEDATDKIAEKAKTLFQEDLLKSSELITLQDALSQHTLETKASRETIMRLVSEVGKEQKSVSEVNNNLDHLKKERDDAVFEKENLERELELLRERLEAREKAWSTSREEVSQRLNREITIENDLKSAEHDKKLAQNELESFKTTIAQALSDPYVEIEPREDSIKDRIRELTSADREKRSRIEDYESKVRNLSNQLEKQCELHHDAIRRAKSAEAEIYENKTHMRNLEGELASGDVLRDTLRSDKQKYMGFVQDMCEAMNMTGVAADIGYDLNTDIIVARARQLVRLETEALAEKTSSNYNLHRKLKHFKEQLKNKELHMELLRKKVAQLEEKDHTRSGLAIDRDDAIVSVQKLSRKVDRLQKLLGDERAKNLELRAELAETNNLKAITLEQRRRMEELQDTVAKLMTTKDRQRQKLTGLKQELNFSNVESTNDRDRLKSQLDAVTGDLQSTKVAFEEITRREKQLVDFREVVARMLGLDVTSLSIPDYEIISRLEKLIKNHQLGVATSTALERSLTTMDPGFHAGYSEGLRSVKMGMAGNYSHPHPPYRGRSLSPDRHKHHRRSSRSPRRRSPSPRRY